MSVFVETHPDADVGIQPIPAARRTFSGWDNAVLWADLGVSFLVMLVGALIAPSLGLGPTLLAILIGALIGNTLLGLAATIGSDTGVPTMVLLRPALGVRGSYLPSAVNVLQLIGWATFEIVVMALAADGITRALLGVSAPLLWTVIFAAITTAMAVFGPIRVVKQWLGRVAVWLVLATTLWLTYQIATSFDLAALLARPGTGAMSFWLGVDLVVAMPISWMPLVADYSRFARTTRGAFWGTGVGYFVAHVWFYALGALLALSLAVSSPDDLFGALARLSAGVVVLLLILVDETDEGFANIYSAAVSAQNVAPGASYRAISLAVGALCAVLGVALIGTGTPLLQYESFLLLIGAFFVPLMGVLAADYFLLRGRRYETDELYAVGGRYWYADGINWAGIAAWVPGIATYLLIAGLPPLGVPGLLPQIGASLPSLAVAFVAHAILGRLASSRAAPGTS